VKWLHGAVAKNLKANVSCYFHAGFEHLISKNIADFVFSDPIQSFYARKNKPFLMASVNQEGTANVSMKVELA
jgi:hypothetical protein